MHRWEGGRRKAEGLQRMAGGLITEASASLDVEELVNGCGRTAWRNRRHWAARMTRSSSTQGQRRNLLIDVLLRVFWLAIWRPRAHTTKAARHGPGIWYCSKSQRPEACRCSSSSSWQAMKGAVWARRGAVQCVGPVLEWMWVACLPQGVDALDVADVVCADHLVHPHLQFRRGRRVGWRHTAVRESRVLGRAPLAAARARSRCRLRGPSGRLSFQHFVFQSELDA